MVTQPFPRNYAAEMILRAPCIAIVALSAAPAAAQVISAHGDWAALRFGAQCEARSRALRVQRGRPPGFAGFAFGAAGRRQGQFYVRLSRDSRPGSTAVLTVGSQQFLLAARGQWAWGRDARQDSAIMAAVRYSGSMRLEARDGGGRRFVDRYSLGGAATAVDAAAAACALGGKSR
jgi:hypothetical protein